MTAPRLLRRLNEGLWFVPSLCVAAAAGLSFTAHALDAALSQRGTGWYLFQGGPEGARAVLTTISSSMMTFTGVVFSVTILVLQLASNQFSPRVLRTFLRDKKNQLVLGIFIGTFIYSLLTLRSVWNSDDMRVAQVPALSVWLAIVLALLCVGAFVFYIHHVSQAIRAVNVLARIGDETREHLDALFPEGTGEERDAEAAHLRLGTPSLVIPLDGKSGVVTALDEEALWNESCRAEVVISLVPMIGDFVATGRPLFEIHGDPAKLDQGVLKRAVDVDSERSVDQDAAFGLRQLVDVAERALSPGINDPTTAVQAIDQIHDILMRLGRKRIPSAVRTREDGTVRLILPRPDWAAYVHLGVDEIRQCGAGSIQVARRLRFMLEDLLEAVPSERREPLVRELSALTAGVRRSYADAADVTVAQLASPQGNGSTSPETRYP